MKHATAWIVGTIVVIILILCIVKYNKITVLDEGLEKAWAPLINVLNPRYDAVPKLVNEVILYNNSEDQETKKLAEMQKAWAAASGFDEQVKAADKLEGALSAFIVELGQRYPGITSHYQFMNLETDFQKTTEQMGPLVQGYNDAVDQYNAYVRQFPNNLVALILGFQFEADYFNRVK